MKILPLLLGAALCITGTACFPRPAGIIADGSKWVIGPDGDPVKVGSWQHDAEGNPINVKGDADGAKKISKPDAAQGIYQTGAFIGVISRLLILLSAASLIASYWLPWLPKGAAWKGFAVAAGLIVGQYWLVAYGVVFAQVAFWVTLVAAVGAGVAVGYPWVVGLYNRALIAKGKAMQTTEPHMAAGLIAAGSPDDYKTKQDRTELLAMASVGKVV